MMLYIRKHNFRIFAAFAVAMPMLFAAMSLCCCTKGTPYYSKPVEVSIAHLKELYKGHPVTVTENCFIEGVVVSSDKWGNFNKSIFVQDGTGGIEVKLDMDKIFAVYNIGGMVRIYCKGLSLGAYGRLIQLGSAPAAEYETGYIAREDIAGHIEFMGLPEEEILPLSLDFAELTTENAGRIAGCKATFRGVRFVEADGTATWCEPDPDTGKYVDTDRILLDSQGNTLIVRTSRYADFADLALLQGEINIEGVLSWFNDGYQLRVNNESAVY